MRPGVIHHHIHARVEQISHGEGVVQSVIPAEALVAAVSDGVSIAFVRSRVAGRRAWVAERKITETGLVGVGDAIEIYAFGAAVFNAPNHFAGELMFHRRVPHVGIGSLYVWIDNS